MKLGCRSCALAAESSSVLAKDRRKITHTSTSIWALPVRSSAPIVLRYFVSIRTWVHAKLIRQIVLTVSWAELKRCNTASLVMLPEANQRQAPFPALSGRFTRATNDSQFGGMQVSRRPNQRWRLRAPKVIACRFSAKQATGHQPPSDYQPAPPSYCRT
jgi:hypothetical protein